MEETTVNFLPPSVHMHILDRRVSLAIVSQLVTQFHPSFNKQEHFEPH